MQAFIIETANRPGEFARQASAIAQYDINVAAVCLGVGSRGGSAFLARDETGLRTALTGAGIEYHEVPVLTIWLDDKPGTAAKTAKKLADAGVNIELFAPVTYTDGQATIAIGVDKIEEARRVLSDQLTEWKVPEVMHAGIGATS
ncbi:MAG: hypothetical protein E6J47_07945 [Chloroflexi bacterium]|nr:MAG: hypothetical protein E6J47_07945 [Chloroflexota bacterium]